MVRPRDDPSGLEQQHGEDGALLRAAELERTAVRALDLEGPEEAEGGHS